jgi:hypothetical protein
MHTRDDQMVVAQFHFLSITRIRPPHQLVSLSLINSADLEDTYSFHQQEI